MFLRMDGQVWPLKHILYSAQHISFSEFACHATGAVVRFCPMETESELVETCDLHPDVVEWCSAAGLEDYLAWGMHPISKSKETFLLGGMPAREKGVTATFKIFTYFGVEMLNYCC